MTVTPVEGTGSWLNFNFSSPQQAIIAKEQEVIQFFYEIQDILTGIFKYLLKFTYISDEIHNFSIAYSGYHLLAELLLAQIL